MGLTHNTYAIGTKHFTKAGSYAVITDRPQAKYDKSIKYQSFTKTGKLRGEYIRSYCDFIAAFPQEPFDIHKYNRLMSAASRYFKTYKRLPDLNRTFYY